MASWTNMDVDKFVMEVKSFLANNPFGEGGGGFAAVSRCGIAVSGCGLSVSGCGLAESRCGPVGSACKYLRFMRISKLTCNTL